MKNPSFAQRPLVRPLAKLILKAVGLHVLIVALPPVAAAADLVWVGNDSLNTSNFTNSGNWQSNTLPSWGYGNSLKFNQNQNSNVTGLNYNWGEWRQVNDIFWDSTFTVSRTLSASNGGGIGFKTRIENQSSSTQTVAMELSGGSDGASDIQLNPVKGSLIFSGTLWNDNSKDYVVWGSDTATVTNLTLNTALGTNATQANVDFTVAGGRNSAVRVNASQVWAGTTTVNSGSFTTANGVTLASTAIVVGGGTFATTSANTLADTASLTVNTGRLSIGGSDTVASLAGSGGTVDLVAGATLSFGDSGSSSYAGAITGSGNLTKVGSGTFTLSAASSMTGTTTVSAGQFSLGGSNLLADTSAVAVAGGVLALGGNSDTVGAFAISGGSLTGSGTVTAASYTLGGGTVSANLGSGTMNVTGNSSLNGTSNGTTLNLTSGTLTLGSAGRLAATSALAVTGSAGAALTLGGNETIGSLAGAANMAIGSNTLTVGGNGQSTTYSGNLSDSGGFTKVGNGTLTFSGTNTSSGATTISAGILAITSTSGLQGTSGVSIGSGAGLAYAGGAATFGKNITVTSGTGSVTNTGGGLLTLSGTLSKNGTVLRLAGGAFNVTGAIVGSSSNSDLVVAGTSSVTLSAANTYNGPTFVIESSTLAYGINNAIPSNSVVTLGNASSQGTLNMNGYTGAIGGLAFGSGGGTLRVAATSTSAALLTAATGTMTLTNGTLDLAGSGSTAGLYRVLSAQSIGGSFASITGTSAAYQVITSATSVDYQQRAVLGAVTVTNPAVSIITGGSAAFTYTVANSALSGGASLSVTGAGLSNVAGSSSGTAAAAGTSSSISGLFFSGTTVGSGQQGTFTVSAPTAFGSTTATGTVSVNVLDHSNAALSLASGGGQTIITGGSFATVGFNLTNAGSNRAAVQVNSLTNLTGGTGSSVVLSGGTASYTASIANNTSIGTSTLSVSMLAGDQQSLSGASALQTLTGSTSYTVLDHSNAALALAGGNNQTIITGGSLNAVTFSLTNAGTGRSALDVSTLSNLSGTSGSAVVASNGSATYTASGFNTAAVGQNKSLTVSLQAGDQQSLAGANALATYTGTATYTVLDHATSSLASGSTSLSTVLNLGTWDYSLNAWTSGTSAGQFSIFNLASSFGASLTADLALLSVSGTGNGFTTNLNTYADIAGGSSRQYSVFVDPTSFLTSGTQSWTFTLAMGDQTGLSGALASNTLSVTASVVVVPEPSTWAMALAAIGCGGWMVRRRRRDAR